MIEKNNSTSPETSQQILPYPIEEDEISLIELFLVILKHKRMIIKLVFFVAVATVTISLLMTNIYRSEATICPRKAEESGGRLLSGLGGLGGMVAGQLGLGGNNGDVEKIKALLESRELTSRVIQRYDLIPSLYKEKWDSKNNIWKTDYPPTLQDAVKKTMDNLLKVEAEKKSDFVTIGFEYRDPAISQKVVNYYLTELSSILREEVLRDAVENKRFFKEQLEVTTDSLLKEKIANLLASEIEKETFAKAQKYYSFLIIDPPVVPDADKKVRPKRAIICILSVFMATFIGVFAAFIIEFIEKIKKDDPDRYQELIRGIRFWKWRQFWRGSDKGAPHNK